MKKVIKKDTRNKAFIGAAIGAVGSLVGGLIGGAKKRKAELRAREEQQKEQNTSDTLQAAQAMSSGMADQSYVDEYQKKITLKMGGKMNSNKKFNDRIKRDKIVSKRIYKCGGRHKSEIGSWTKNDTKDLITGISTGINNALSISSGTSTPTITMNSLKTNNNINTNNKIAAEQQMLREKSDNTNTIAGKKDIISNTAKFGIKKKINKAMFGSNLKDSLAGIGSLIGGLTTSSKPTSTVKKEQGFTTSAPKIGIQKPDYQNNNTNINSNHPEDSQFKDRDQQFRIGGKRKVKRIK